MTTITINRYLQLEGGTSITFLILALSLRYKAGIELVVVDTDDSSSSRDREDRPSSFFLSPEQLQLRYPNIKTVLQLKQQAAGIDRNIQNTYAIHKLQAAYRIALQKEDYTAADKIRKHLDELDRQQPIAEIPIQTESNYDAME